MIFRGVCILVLLIVCTHAQETTTPIPTIQCEQTLFGLNYYNQQVLFWGVFTGTFVVCLAIGIGIGVAAHESIQKAWNQAGEWVTNRHKRDYQVVPAEQLPSTVIPLYVSTDSKKVILADIYRQK